MNITTRRILKSTAFSAGSLLLIQAALRAARNFSYAGKNIFITGGSRGLGFTLAKQLLDLGANVCICARDEAELTAAVTKLSATGGAIRGIVCDVRDRKQVYQCINQFLDTWASIDILFNVAGIIEVGPFDAITEMDFQNSMQTNCWGPLYTMSACIPHMRKQHWGRIVNIASIGGKRAVPHMLPYDTSKFALVGLSTGLRAELAQDGIVVTTVCPGLMRTGSPRNATFKGQHRKEFAWFSLGDSLPLVSMSADRAAEKILHACKRGDAEVILSGFGRLMAGVQTFFPNLSAEAFTLMNYALPAMGGIGTASAKGYESTSRISPSFLTRLGDQAAIKNNELRSV